MHRSIGNRSQSADNTPIGFDRRSKNRPKQADQMTFQIHNITINRRQGMHSHFADPGLLRGDSDSDKSAAEYRVRDSDSDKSAAEYRVRDSDSDKSATEYRVRDSDSDKSAAEYRVRDSDLDKSAAEYRGDADRIGPLARRVGPLRWTADPPWLITMSHKTWT